MHTLTERTYVNRDSTKVVSEGSVDAAFLLGNEGDEISDETAARLGLKGQTSSGYGALKVADLRKLVDERGLEVGADAKKADLVDALEASDSTSATATAATGGTASEGAPDATTAATTPAEA